MLATPHPGRLGFQDNLDRAQVQRPPPAPTLPSVVARGASTAPSAPAPRPLPRTNMSDQQLLVLIELDGFDHRLLDPEQGSP
jgi:hypothetical protein